MDIHVVIGGNYGDEGKGQFTADLAYNSSLACVVRYNGGAQAGHSVAYYKDHVKKKHIFKHFGSGTFEGAPTILVREFICNPIEFVEEYNQLIDIGHTPQVFVHESCRITTPFDMIMNIAREQYRSRCRYQDRHGSCGLGIFETICRDKDIKLTVKTLRGLDKNAFVDLMKLIYTYYLEKIKLAFVDYQLVPTLENYEDPEFLDQMITNFWNDSQMFLNQVKTFDCVLGKLISNEIGSSTVIFEGAQGLLLDEKYGVAPHLTPSSTGAEIPYWYISNELRLWYSATFHYLTRPYVTRHGNGPLANECDKDLLNITFTEDTNVLNDNQGKFRFGMLDINKFAAVATVDFLNHVDRFYHSTDVSMKIELTCASHVKDYQTRCIYQGVEIGVKTHTLRHLLSNYNLEKD